MNQVKSSVVTNEHLAGDYWRMTLDATNIATEIRAGQFVNVRLSSQPDAPLFRRPFSVFRWVSMGGSGPGIEIIYKVVGRGTKMMVGFREGYELDVIGPLGRGFEWCRDRKRHILVGGGVGAAALFMLGEEISREISPNGFELYVFIGVANRAEAALGKEFTQLGRKVMISTDDGTYGYHGTVVDMLQDVINKEGLAADSAIYACGPEPMLRELSQVCRQYDIPAQVSIERHMMCGLGACLSCVCKVNKDVVVKRRDIRLSHIQLSPQEEYGYALVCKDGPVFNIDELVFDA